MARCSNCGRNEGEHYTVHGSEGFMTGQDSYDSRQTTERRTTGAVRRCVDCGKLFCTDCMTNGRCYEDNVKHEEVERKKQGWWYCERCGRQKEPSEKHSCSVCGVKFCSSCGYGQPTEICFPCNRKKIKDYGSGLD